MAVSEAGDPAVPYLGPLIRGCQVYSLLRALEYLGVLVLWVYLNLSKSSKFLQVRHIKYSLNPWQGEGSGWTPGSHLWSEGETAPFLSPSPLQAAVAMESAQKNPPASPSWRMVLCQASDWRRISSLFPINQKRTSFPSYKHILQDPTQKPTGSKSPAMHFPQGELSPPPSPGLVGLVPALSSLPHSGALCLPQTMLIPSFLLPSQMTSTESAGLWSSHFLISTLYSSRGMDSRCSEKTYWASRCTFFWWTRWFQGPLPRSACSPPRLWVPFYGAVNSRWKHTSVNHGKRLCLGHRLDHWKNHGFQPINESEINVVLPFICSIVGLPEKDKINPWVHSENST